ncbi:hypothetical protein PVAG01_05234 [Phlyctema vagabunda]|uniref:Uncharacterized protein n=1 Tax=Phlyctema vagabunda TaxID=108571 RepID=A0ABR4PK76_9HELO
MPRTERQLSTPENRGVPSINNRPRNTARVFSDLSEARSSILSKGARSDNGSSAAASEHSPSPSPEPVIAQANKTLGPLPHVLMTRDKSLRHPNVLFRTPDETLTLGTRGRPVAESNDTKQAAVMGTSDREAGIPVEYDDNQGLADGYVDIELIIEPLKTVDKYRKKALAANKEYNDQILSSKEAGQAAPGAEGNFLKSNESSSLQESSTIDRLISGYGDDGDMADNELPSMASNQYDPRASDSNLQSSEKEDRITNRSAGLPPTRALPKPPQHKFEPRTTQSSSDVQDQMSYGDNNGFAHPPHAAQSQGADVYVASPSRSFETQGGDNSEQFYASQDEQYLSDLDKIVAKDVEDHSDQFGLEQDAADTQKERRPLERDVSKALRRETGLSTNSLDEPGVDVQGLTKSYKSTLSDVVDVEENTKNPRDASFYDKSAFETENVRNTDTEVRVPIDRTVDHYNAPVNQRFNNAPGTLRYFSPSDTRHAANAESHGPANQEENMNDAENADDWVTEPERLSGTYEEGFLGGPFQRTGSSIANRSDDESIQMVDDFGSTDRIAQHPAPIGHSGRYFVREIKHAGGGPRQQMLLPAEENDRQHRVNGFLKNSSRFDQPRPTVRERPEPLQGRHENPFKVTPPQMPQSPPRVWGRRHRRQDAVVDRYMFGSSNTDLSDHVDQAALPYQDIHSVGPLPLDLTGRSLHLASQFQRASPASHHEQSPSKFLGVPDESDGPPRVNSFQHVLMMAKGEHVPGYNADGTLIAEYGDHGDYSPVGRTIGNRNRQGVSLVVSSEDAMMTSSPYTPTPKVRTAGNDSVYSPGSDIEMQSLPSSDRYRRRSHWPRDRAGWQEGISRLGDPSILEAVDDMYPAQQKVYDRETGTYTLIRQRPGGGFDRILASPEEMASYNNAGVVGYTGLPTHYQRNRAVKTADQVEQAKHRCAKLSIIALILCNFFPPTLLVLSAGGLDSTIDKWTRSEVKKIGATQKTIASTLAGIWVGAIVIALVIFLILYFRK